MKGIYLSVLILGFSIYSLFYGALCWELARFTGLLIGSSFYLTGGLIGLILK